MQRATDINRDLEFPDTLPTKLNTIAVAAKKMDFSNFFKLKVMINNKVK